jgi:hypothetical protein
MSRRRKNFSKLVKIEGLAFELAASGDTTDYKGLTVTARSALKKASPSTNHQRRFTFSPGFGDGSGVEFRPAFPL